MSKEEKHKTLLRTRHIADVFNKGKLEVADEIISPDYVFHQGPLGEFKGPEGFKRMVTMARTAMPDIHYTIDDMIAEGDRVAVLYTMTGTFTGKLGEIPPTGKRVNMKQVFFYRFKDGKEVEALPLHDANELNRQLGINPPAPK